MDPEAPRDASSVLREPDAKLTALPESVLHTLWAERRYNADRLATTRGAAIQVLDPGRPNTDAGPDFLRARLRIQEPSGWIEWTGDVEIHRTSAEWIEHGHQRDPRYNRVVLHVVLDRDERTGSLHREDGTVLPECLLLPVLDAPLRTYLYEALRRVDLPFPCAPTFGHIDAAVRREWVRTLGQQRLAMKAERAAALAADRGEDEALYRLTFTALGYAKNASPMQTLTEEVPLSALRRLDDPLDVEALLFGAAGFLEPTSERDELETATYRADLQARYERIAVPHRALSMEAWQFFRLRPANFPTRRIAQGAALVGPGGLLLEDARAAFRAALESRRPLSACVALLRRRGPSSYWTRHYRFGPATTPTSALLGEAQCRRILIDAVAPYLWFAAESKHDRNRVVTLLEAIPGPTDAVVRLYTDRGYCVRDAVDVMGLHQLHRAYCQRLACLTCRIGHRVLAPDPSRNFSPPRNSPNGDE